MRIRKKKEKVNTFLYERVIIIIINFFFLENKIIKHILKLSYIVTENYKSCIFHGN